MRLGGSGDAVNERGDVGEVQVQLVLGKGGFGRFDAGFGGKVGLNGVVQFLLADRVLFGQRDQPIGVQFRLMQLRQGDIQLGVGLIGGGLENPLVNLEKHVSFVDKSALLVLLGDQVAGYLGANLRVGRAVQGADPLLIHRHICRHGRDHFHIGGRRRLGGGGRRLVAPGRGGQQGDRKKKSPARR